RLVMRRIDRLVAQQPRGLEPVWPLPELPWFQLLTQLLPSRLQPDASRRRLLELRHQLLRVIRVIGLIARRSFLSALARTSIFRKVPIKRRRPAAIKEQPSAKRIGFVDLLFLDSLDQPIGPFRIGLVRVLDLERGGNVPSDEKLTHVVRWSSLC